MEVNGKLTEDISIAPISFRVVSHGNLSYVNPVSISELLLTAGWSRFSYESRKFQRVS